jgi:hypothetical protein
VAELSFLIGVLMQSTAIIPASAEMAHTISHLVVGFIHLNVLGFITCYILGVGFDHHFMPNNKRATWGGYVFVLGIIGSELYLFLQGLFFWLEIGFLPLYYEGVFIASALLPLGLIIILSSFAKKPYNRRLLTSNYKK